MILLIVWVSVLLSCLRIWKTISIVYNNAIGSGLQELILKGNKHIVLTGAPGTGKTYTAREYVKSELGLEYDNLDGLTVHKLTKDNPTMQQMFEEAGVDTKTKRKRIKKENK